MVWHYDYSLAFVEWVEGRLDVIKSSISYFLPSASSSLAVSDLLFRNYGIYALCSFRYQSIPTMEIFDVSSILFYCRCFNENLIFVRHQMHCSVKIDIVQFYNGDISSLNGLQPML